MAGGAVFQIHFTGCAGDTTACKYSTGARDNRPVLAERLYSAMAEAWRATRRQPLKQVEYRVADLHLPARSIGKFAVEAMIGGGIRKALMLRMREKQSCSPAELIDDLMLSPVVKMWLGKSVFSWHETCIRLHYYRRGAR